jgi:pimeloyl-ACP methyl ester carboxylesterase
VHGLGSSKDSPRNVPIAAALVDAGIATILFDLSGHGDSTGAAGDGVRAYVDDLRAVFEWAVQQAEIDPARIALAGSSMGAVVAIQAASEGRIRPIGMVLRAPPAERGQLRGLDVPALVLIGSEDPLAPQVVAAVREGHGLELSVIEGASHLFEEAGTLEEALRRTVAWLQKTLRTAGAAAARA